MDQRDYIDHEVKALWHAIDRGDVEDVLSTIATLRQELHLLSLPYGGPDNTCARLAQFNGRYVLPSRLTQHKEG